MWFGVVWGLRPTAFVDLNQIDFLYMMFCAQGGKGGGGWAGHIRLLPPFLTTTKFYETMMRSKKKDMFF